MSRPEVLVFVQEGCPSCDAIKPLVDQMSRHYATCVDTRVVDVYAEEGFADAMGVEETPTVIGVNPAKRPVVRMVGHDGNPNRLVQIYAACLMTVTTCSVPPWREI